MFHVENFDSYFVADWNVKQVNEDDDDENSMSNASLIVGTPQSIKTSIISRKVKTEQVQLLFIDEGSKTASLEHQGVITEILALLSPNIQLVFCSDECDINLTEFLGDKISFVQVGNETFVLNYKQLFELCQAPPLRALQMKAKSDQLLKIFDNIKFGRCIVFSNYQSRVKSLSCIAEEKGFKSVAVPEKPVKKKKSKRSQLGLDKCNIVFATDDTLSNIGKDEFDLVINYDIPDDGVKFIRRLNWSIKETGVCINLSTDENDLKQLQSILCSICGPRIYLPKLVKTPTNISDLLNDQSQCIEKVLCRSQFRVDFSIRNEILNLRKRPTKRNLDTQNDDEPSKPVSNNVELCIMDILDETSNEVKELREQLSDMSTDTLMQCLASGNFSFNSHNSCESESKWDLTDEDKKQKDCKSKSLFEILISENTFVKNVDDMLHSDETKLVERNQENVFYRNKALLDVTKIVSDKGVSLDDCDDNSILTHLNILKSQEQEKLSQTQIEDVNDLVRKIKADGEMENGEIKISQASGSETGTGEIHLEQIFNFGYKSIIGGKNSRWKMQLAKFKPDENSKIASQTSDDSDEDMKETSTMLDERVDENVVDNGDNIMKWVPVTTASKTPKKQENRVELMTCFPNEQSPQTDGEGEAEQIDIHHNGMDMIHNSNTVQQTMSRDVDSDAAVYRHFEHYYNSCSENLWQNALTFPDVNSFDEWFYCNWEVQLSSIRSYIQQNIYVQEMSHYQNSRSSNPN